MSKAKWKYTIIVLLATAILIGMAIPTMYAMVKVQGVGMYWAMQIESIEYDKYNWLATMWGMLALAVFLAIPCIRKRNRNLTYCFCFMTMYFAFVPVVSPALFCHLFDGQNLLAVVVDKNYIISAWADFQPMFFMFLIMVGCICACRGLKLEKWHRVMLCMGLIAGVGLSFLVELSLLLMFWMIYLMIIPASDVMKKIFESHERGKERVLLWLCIAVLWGRGIYRMLEIVATYLVWA